MHIIEPCCTKKHLCRLREGVDKGETRSFECYGDMSISELLPALMTRYAEAEMLIAAPCIPDQAAEAIALEMRRRWSRSDGTGKMDEIAHLTIVTDLGRSPMLSHWLKRDAYGERLTVVDRRQEENVILLPDIAILGFKNMRYGEHFVGTITGAPERVEQLWEQFRTSDLRTEEKPAQAIRPKQAAAKRKKARRRA